MTARAPPVLAARTTWRGLRPKDAGGRNRIAGKSACGRARYECGRVLVRLPVGLPAEAGRPAVGLSNAFTSSWDPAGNTHLSLAHVDQSEIARGAPRAGADHEWSAE